MPFAIDEEALNSPSLTQLDIAKPPTKSIPYQAYPKLVYLHPKDKTKEHEFLQVNNEDELDAAQKQGYQLKPHIQQTAPRDMSAFETGEPVKRGVGRPPNA